MQKMIRTPRPRKAVVMLKFKNRSEAGQLLAQRLAKYKHRPDVLVMALPRGGVPVGYEVATVLGARLDVLIVRKLGVPGHEELAMGAIASGGLQVLNGRVVEDLGISENTIKSVAAHERCELERREKFYRSDQPAPEVQGCVVILVDDGIATGSTVRAAIMALRQLEPVRIVVAAPVVALSTARELRNDVDELVAVILPVNFSAVGEWYENFTQTTDEEVKRLLNRSYRFFSKPELDRLSKRRIANELLTSPFVRNDAED